MGKIEALVRIPQVAMRVDLQDAKCRMFSAIARK